MPTRQWQIGFEHNQIIESFKKANIAETITKIILSAVTSELSEKFKYYCDKIPDLEKEIIVLETKITGVPDSEYVNTKQKLSQLNKKSTMFNSTLQTIIWN